MHASSPAVATVILDQAVGKSLDYAIPEDLQTQVEPGMRVAVPLKQGMAHGTIVEIKTHSSFASLVELSALLHEQPRLTTDLLKLSVWMAGYYCTPLDKVIKMILPPAVRKDIRMREQLWIKSNRPTAELIEYCKLARETHPSHATLLDTLLRFPKGMFLTELKERSNVSDHAIQALLKQGLLRTHLVHGDRSLLSECKVFPSKSKKLSEEQSHVLESITKDLHANAFRVHYLHGVTGSGKTEIYLQAIAHAFAMQKQVLFLIPEIALAEQTFSIVRARFQEPIALLHHRLSHGERNNYWEKMCQNNISLVVGARSAIFAPLPRLGLIIVDEEHEGAYKNEEAPSYHARDIAIMRGKMLGATVILGSATPSLESYHNALMGKYTLSTLKTRVASAKLPVMHIVDMRKEKERKNFSLFSEPLVGALKRCYARGEQALLFLNRRGYHTLLLCASCGSSLHCPNCDIALTFYRSANHLACHLCDHRLAPPPTECPTCKLGKTLKFKGVGTEFVERALHALLPEMRTLRMDADTTAHKGSHELLFKQFKSGKADVLIGTQMIAKGLHFPSVTLVGILNADSVLHIPDFRSTETLFQLLLQVSGRAGRGDLPGEVFVQTHMPDHLVIRQAVDKDYLKFFYSERENRKAFGFPPYSKLIKLSLSGLDEKETKHRGEILRTALIAALPSSITIYPLVPSGHARIKGQYRFQFLIKGEKLIAHAPMIAKIAQQNFQKDVKLLIDVDPLDTFF